MAWHFLCIPYVMPEKLCPKNEVRNQLKPNCNGGQSLQSYLVVYPAQNASEIGSGNGVHEPVVLGRLGQTPPLLKSSQ